MAEVLATEADERASAVPAPAPVAGADVPARRGRGRPPSRLFDLRGELPGTWRLVLSGVGMLGVFGLWLWVAGRGGDAGLVPSPAETLTALRTQWQEGTLSTDFGASVGRIAVGYAISIAFGVVVGVAIGSLRSVEATLEAPIGFMRYVPATALTPLLLLWMGIGEAPKITLIAVGTVFFNILMVADVARNVPRELLEASYTLGATRRTVLRRVVLRHSLPGIIDVARINLAAGWLMLVVAELLAAQEGLAFRIVRAQRFRQVDTMFGMLIVFGVIGMASDLTLRKLRDVTSPWARP
ncbi:MAG TPA: ABC transporter permease [Acidimicrobiales bacterium]|nr:ABC transporter permease [Acidimicrobiales bacterium]